MRFSININKFEYAVKCFVLGACAKAALEANYFIYSASRFFSKFIKLQSITHEVVFVVAPQNRGWILDKVANTIAADCIYSPLICYREKNIIPGNVVFFSHYSLFLSALKTQPILFHSKKVIFFTHINNFTRNKREIYYSLRLYADIIVCMNNSDRLHLSENGVAAEKLVTLIGGFDNKFFYYTHFAVPINTILICAAYYERKNPQLILELAKILPGHKFTILGKGWDKSPYFSKFQVLENVSFKEAHYDDYPAIYQQHSIFFSASLVEGGPIPLLEAMAMNLTPVVSRTGFAVDIIRNGENGYLFDIGVSAEDVAQLILKITVPLKDVYKSVEDYSWQAFSQKANEIIQRVAVLD